MLALATSADSGDIVMDFFAGSGTTADAVLQQNAEDGGNRQFILVQLPDDGDGRQKSIPDVARERVRAAGKAVAAEAGLVAGGLDVGFRSLRIDTSSFADVTSTPDDLVQTALVDTIDGLRLDRSGEDLLFQVLLDWGLELSLPITRQDIDGCEVLAVDDGALLACFANDVTPAVVKAMAERHPLRVVFRDSGFADDAARINAEQVFRELSPETDVRAI